MDFRSCESHDREGSSPAAFPNSVSELKNRFFWRYLYSFFSVGVILVKQFGVLVDVADDFNGVRVWCDG